MTEGVLRINDVLSQADEIDRREGQAAYESYNLTMNKLADHYSFPFPSVVGAFAALSPNNDYIKNLRSTAT